MDTERWRLIEEHFDKARVLSRDRRAAYVARIAQADPALRIELESLLDASECAAGFLEEPASMPAGNAPTAETLAAGFRLGAWRVVRLIGHGGMGEVYEVERGDGQFEQRAALKLTRREAAKQLDRFNAERQILARLDHPGIARLLDGGVAPDGRPYAVMEYVEGQGICEYCQARHAALNERLTLFLQVCDAVAHAHLNLIVHRDIKPSNILVDTEGRARLLDFGIAKPLDAAWPGASAGNTTTLLTPDYAAPEQLKGEPVTTATDVYALGVLLFELLVGRKPWITAGRPFAQILNSMLEYSAPLASRTAASAALALVPARLLKGDLDAIVAKCLRREPEHRYPTVNALKLDIERSLRGDSVLARGDAASYVLGRLIHRYRWAAAAVAAIIFVLAVGVAVATWQADRASQEARRATAARDFLISVFRESDPRIARDRPAGEITAKELLDQSVDRIATEFVDDPETQLELLGVASEIYGYWLDEARFVALLEKRKDIARKHFGPTHPAFIESVTLDAWDSIYEQNYASAQRLLAEADRLIREGHHEGSLLRAHWWLAKAEALKNASQSDRMQALDRAAELFATLAPDDANHGIALANSAVARFVREDYAGAKDRNEKAVAVFLKAKNRSDGELAMTYANLARSLQHLGEFEAAERAYEAFATLKRRIQGERHGSYWQGAADHARLVHLRGERPRAQRMFDELLKLIPSDWKTTTDDVVAREYYAERLAAEGRAAEAIPLLEAAERSYLDRPMREFDLRRVRQTLGDAYDRLGRSDDARRALSAARVERMQKDAPDSIAVLGTRERWARFMLDHGDLASASVELESIVRIGADRASAPLALAHSDLARLAVLRRDARTALEESRVALATLDRITGLYDVRVGPQLWRTHAAVLELNGDANGAVAWNRRALEASRRYDDPSSPSIMLATSAAN